MRLTKKTYLQGFLVTVAILAVIRWTFPEVATAGRPNVASHPALSGSVSQTNSAKNHRILSVPSYKEAFPDTNAVQLIAAQQWGVSPVKNREDAEARKRELVYIGSNPYYHVDPLSSSIPYLRKMSVNYVDVM